MKRLQHSLYHKVLRVSMVVAALILLFDSGIVSPITQQLSQDSQVYLATVVGVGAAVEPTELNTLTAELTKQRSALDEREAAVAEREIAIGLNTGNSESSNFDISAYLMSTLLFIILTLIVLNYVLDFMREKHLRALALHQKAG